MPDQSALPPEHIVPAIYMVRGVRVMLDTDLAVLYGATTKRLNQQVKRNLDRFPGDFLFQLSPNEVDNLRLQTATSSAWGGRRYSPFAFTEHGAVMLASVLNSPQAVAASVEVVRAFVRMRAMLPSHHADLARRIDALEARMDIKDDDLRVVFEALTLLMEPPEPVSRRIGFRSKDGPDLDAQAAGPDAS